MRTDLLFGRLLLIYQMPKTGSQTVEATLQACSLPHRIFRFHYLGPTMQSSSQEFIDSGQTSPAWKREAKFQLDLAATLRQTIRRRRWLRWCGFPVPKLEVITGVRDLIGLALSSIFQNWSCFAPDPAGLTVERCRELLLRPNMFAGLDSWFEHELGHFLGVDVYRTAFPREKGYQVYETRQARVLVYRLEVLPRLPQVLREFLGCEVPELVKRNCGSEKAYGELYRSVKVRLTLPAPFVAARYHTRLMRHFFSETERREFERQWSEQPGAGQLLATAADCRV